MVGGAKGTSRQAPAARRAKMAGHFAGSGPRRLWARIKRLLLAIASAGDKEEASAATMCLANFSLISLAQRVLWEKRRRNQKAPLEEEAPWAIRTPGNRCIWSR